MPVFIQLAEEIIVSLRGSSMPGDALPGERQLAERYQVSRGTIVAALDYLAENHLVERLPARGTFLLEAFLSGAAPRRILLPYPEPRISPEFLLPELWAISTEIQRGMLDEALSSNCAVVFQHFEEATTPRQLAGQLQRVAEYDGAVFIGLQLSALREGIAATGKPCVMVATPAMLQRFPDVSMVSFEMEHCLDALAALLAERGYRRLGAMHSAASNPLDAENDRNKLAALRAAAGRQGIILDPERIFEIPIGTLEGNAAAVAERISHPLKPDEAMFCMRTDYVDAIYHLVSAGNMEFRDFPFFGFATGLTFMNLSPQPTYVKIGYHAMGRAACQAIFEGLQAPSTAIAASGMQTEDSASANVTGYPYGRKVPARASLVRKLVRNELVVGETLYPLK